jgi:long-chain acyl-CoA synthetase
VGKAIPGVTITMVDGEICASGNNIFSGYYGSSKKTHVLHTGDLGYKDTEGNIYITGRKKHLIVFPTGDKIQLEDIESLALQYTYVEEACVLYKTYPTFTTIVLIYFGTAEEDLLKTYLNQHLPLYAHVTICIKSLSEFPKTHTHKLKRERIAELFQDSFQVR